MSFFASLFGPKLELPQDVGLRLDKWQSIKNKSEQDALADTTFVIVDVETSGLNPKRDRLLAIGACVLRGNQLWAGAGFERILYHEEVSSKENILVHGIAPGEQAAGLPVDQALLDFLEFAGKHVLVAYHALFDRTAINRATRETLGIRMPNRWLDLAHLAPALYPEARMPLASLDDWLGRFNIQVQSRHRAMDDVLATGELMLILLKRAQQRGFTKVGALLAEAEAQERTSL